MEIKSYGQAHLWEQIIVRLHGRDQKQILSLRFGIVTQEVDETIYWLELLTESNIINLLKVENLMNEAKELLAIFISTGKTAKINK